jgi:hypothetical protein
MVLALACSLALMGKPAWIGSPLFRWHTAESGHTGVTSAANSRPDSGNRWLPKITSSLRQLPRLR